MPPPLSGAVEALLLLCGRMFCRLTRFLGQSLLDAVQEEGALGEMVLLQVFLELLEQLGGHLKGHGPFIIHAAFPSLFIRVEAGDEPCHVLT